MRHDSPLPPLSLAGAARRVALAAAAALALACGGCGESATGPQLPAVAARFAGLAGRVVAWETNLPTRGAVRYGFVSGRYDHLAYPAAAAGADKAYTRSHAVPLLDAAPGATLYVQYVDVTEDGRQFAAAETSLAFAALPAAAPLLRFTALDVRFGDAHVLRLPTADRVVMIDAGDRGEGLSGETAPQHVMRWLDDHGVGRLDYVVATHLHGDHVGGFLDDGADGSGLLERYEIGLFLDVPAVSANQFYRTQMRTILEARTIAAATIAAGMTDKDAAAALAWDPLVGVAVLNAGAQPEWAGTDGTSINNDSVVFKISYGDVDLVAGGDCEQSGESRVLGQFGAALAGVEGYKASHHGRYDANSVPYLAAIAPRVALVPVAFNAYAEGPEQGAQDTGQTLQRLGNLRADVYRFDAAEPLGRSRDDRSFWHTTFTTDGVSYEVRIEPSVWGL